MKVAYADPPYPGQSVKHYADHPDFAGEVDHAELIERMEHDYDAWVLHTGSNNLKEILALCPDLDGSCRVAAWVKPFAAYKRNVSPAYAWEPVILRNGRHAEPNRIEGLVMRDWVAESITLKKGLTGVKPERVCWWLFEAMGLEPDDELDDLFPGTGAVTRAWETWRDQLTLKAVA
jgi:hypothetical protein